MSTTGATSSQPSCQSRPSARRNVNAREPGALLANEGANVLATGFNAPPRAGDPNGQPRHALAQAFLASLLYESIISFWAHSWADSTAILSLMTFWIMSERVYFAS